MGMFSAVDLEEQCNKAARTLKTFIDKGKIPTEVIGKAKGLAIFSAFRAGMWFAGSAGSGVVVARLPDGSWSPPSAFTVRSGSFGVVTGVDIFDCICVLNTQEAVDAYSKHEMQIGGGVTAAAGPLSGTANAENSKSVWTYTRSKGLYGGLTLDSTSLKEVPEANADFYGGKVTAAQILRGEVQAQDKAKKWPLGAQRLVEVLRLADNKNADGTVLQAVDDQPEDINE